ncbi:unnamed protein product [Urochloa humidicola]
MAEAVVSAVVAEVVGTGQGDNPPEEGLLVGRLRADGCDVVDGKLRQQRHLVVKLERAVEAAGARRIASRALLQWLSELAGGAHRGPSLPTQCNSYGLTIASLTLLDSELLARVSIKWPTGPSNFQ